MKNNRTNRKLKFIRRKNKLRLGQIKYSVSYKISEQNIQNYYYLIDEAELLVMKLFKLKLRHVEFNLGHCQNDFIMNLVTFRITLHNHPNHPNP